MLAAIMHVTVKALNVLLIEDGSNHNWLFVEMLREVKTLQLYQVKLTELTQALYESDFQARSVILLDLSQSHSLGLETIAQIHALHPNIPLIVLDDYPDETWQTRVLQQGAQDYLIKGELTRYNLSKAITCVSERYRLQLELQQARQEIKHLRQEVQMLQQSESRFRSLVRHAMDGITILSADGTIVYESPSIEQRLGYRPEELIGTNTFALLHPDDYERVRQCFQEGLGKPGIPQSVHYRYRHKNGTWRSIEAIGCNLLHDPSVKGIVINNRDVTERNHYEADLYRAKEAAEAGSRAKSEFLAIMSHELRTPLNAILGLSQLLRQEIFGELNPKQKEYVTCIYSSGEQLLSLINDILDLSKVEAGKEALHLSTVSIPDVCAYCLSVVRERAYESGLKLTSHLDEQARSLVADERRLRQMLLNLLSNAIKFTTIGEVSLLVQKQPEGVTFTVTDTGIGIAPEHLDDIFEPFHQVDSRLNRHYEGTGLGLTLTYRLAKMHGGTVTVTSKVNEGSQFTLYLPDIAQESL